MIFYYLAALCWVQFAYGEIKWVGEGEKCTPPIFFLGVGYNHMKTDNVKFPNKIVMPEEDETRLYCQGHDLCTYNMITRQTTCMLVFPFGEVCKADEECAINMDLDTHENFLAMKCMSKLCSADGLICKREGENCDKVPCCPGYMCESPRDITEWVYLGSNWDKKKVLLFSKHKSNSNKKQKTNIHSTLHQRKKTSNLFPKFGIMNTVFKAQAYAKHSHKNDPPPKVCVDKTKITYKVTKKLAIPKDKNEEDMDALPVINTGKNKKMILSHHKTSKKSKVLTTLKNF